jgi:hypothetical protein
MSDWFKVLVTGGRKYANQTHMWRVLDKLWIIHPDIFIIHGDATGADRLADSWAVVRLGMDRVKRFPAKWAVTDDTPKWRVRWDKGGNPYDMLAGADRNQQMLDEGLPDMVLAFPGGSGTRDMLRRAKYAKKHILHFQNLIIREESE